MISNFSSTEHSTNSKLLLVKVLCLDVYSNLMHLYQHQKRFFPIMGIGVAPHKAMKEGRVKLLLCNRTKQSKEKSLINLPVNALFEYIIILSLH